MKRMARAALGATVMALLAATAMGFINAAFTPINLLNESDAVLQVQFKKVSEKGLVTAAVTKVLKGNFEPKEFTIDLMAGAFPAQGQNAMAVINHGQKEGLMFIGKFSVREENEQPAAEPEERGFLHMSAPGSAKWQWLVLERGKDGGWDMVQQKPYLMGTWASGTDMLLRCLNYIQSDPEADVPVSAGVYWDPNIFVGKVPGKVTAVRPLNLAGKGACELYVASDGGDRVFRMEGSAFRDVTDSLKLASKSLAHVWADLNGDGKLDLASWDGKALVLWLQQADGTFQSTPAGVNPALGGKCLALAALDAGVKGKAGLLVSTEAAPVLLTPTDGGQYQAKPVFAGELPVKDFGPVGRCLVGDLDGDGQADILQLFAGASLLYKGKAAGQFEAPVPTAVAAGQGPYGACLGDFDADGKLDVLTAAEDCRGLWQNLGDGKFTDAIDMSGEIPYISKPGANGVDVGDVNNDGRLDILILYGPGLTPQPFFNRGFRCFGHARDIDLNEQRLLPEAGEGQQAGCYGDFNGDGALDMALVLADGQAWVFPRKLEGKPMAAVVSVSPGCEHPGAVSVMASIGQRSLGAWRVEAGGPGALIGLTAPSPLTLKWRWSDGQEHTRDVVVKKGANSVVAVVLDKP